MSEGAEDDAGQAPAATEAEAPMHIHRPKAPHGLRAFLTEIGVIVLGIVIALAGEQAVEALHWRRVSQETMQDLDKEVRDNLLYAADRRSVKVCLEARLADLRDKLIASNGVWRADPVMMHLPLKPGPHEVVLGHVMPIVHGLPFFEYNHQAWDAARADGVLGHLAREKLAFYSSFYNIIERLTGWQDAESAAAARLAPLAYDTRLEVRQRDAVLAELATIDSNAFYLDQFSRMVLEEARAQGLQPDPAKMASFLKDGREVMGPCVQDYRS